MDEISGNRYHFLKTVLLFNN